MSLIDLLIVTVFLCSTLYIGLRSSKNIKTFKDYAIGNRRFSDFAIFCTLAASCIGGTSTMGCIGKTYSVGIAQIVVQLGVPLALLFVSLVLAQRFGNYYGCCSLGDMFYQAYGKTGKIMAGVTGCLYEVISSGIQFMGMGTALNILTGMPYITCLLISAGIVFIYTGKGGVRAVTFTDVLQFIVLSIAIPLLLIVVLGKVGGIHQLFESLPLSHSTISGDTLHRYLFLALPFMLPTLSPIYVQRFLMAKTRHQGSNACYKVFWVYLCVAFMAVLLGLCARVLLPNLDKADKALVTLVGQNLPVGVYGFVVAGILAILMSTVDSQLNSGSIMFVNDIVVPLLGGNVSDKAKLRMSRLAAWMIGIGAIVFASYSTSIFEVKVIGKSLWLSVILVPLYFLLFNLKISVKGLLFSGISGLGTIFLWNAHIKPITKIDGLFPGLLVNLVLVLLFYFLGGGKKVLSQQELDFIRQNEESEPKENFNENKFRFKNNVLLGLCLLFIQMVPLIFLSGVVTPVKISLVMLNGTMAVLLIFGTSLAIFNDKQYFAFFRLCALLLCLPLTSVYLLFTAPENGLHLLTLIISLLIMTMVTDERYREKMLMFCVGLAISVALAIFKTDLSICWPLAFQGWHIVYLLGFGVVVLLLRSSVRILKFEKELAVLSERYKLARNISHDIMTPMMVLRLLLQKKPSEISEEERKLMLNTVNEMSGIVDSIIPGSYKKYENLSLENINRVIEDCVAKKKFLYQGLQLRLDAQEKVFARVDAILLGRVISNVLNVCLEALPTNEGVIVISVGKDVFGNVQIVFRDNGNGLSKMVLSKIFNRNERLSDEIGFGVGLGDIRKVITGWRGLLTIESGKDQGSCVRILLPGANYSRIIEEDSNIEKQNVVRRALKGKTGLYDPLTASQFVILDSSSAYLLAAEVSAERLGLTLKTFQLPEAMFAEVGNLPKGTCFFIEHEPNGVFDGIEVAKKLAELGFKNLVLISAFVPDIPDVDCVRRVMDKNLPIFETKEEA
ncbi:MAG: sodium:solute symporter family transporter [bacterium]